MKKLKLKHKPWRFYVVRYSVGNQKRVAYVGTECSDDYAIVLTKAIYPDAQNITVIHREY